MDEQDSQKIMMEASLNHALKDEAGTVLSSGEARASIDDRYLSIRPVSGEPWIFSLADIVGISEEDYKIDVFLTSKMKLALSELGFRYEDFLTNLYRLRNELLLRYMLMDEKLRERGVEASFVQYDDAGEEEFGGTCELRLYETALLVLPQKGEPLRTPYSYITGFREEGYSIVVDTESKERLVFAQMGEKRDFFRRKLSEAMAELSMRTKSMIKEMLPEADPIKIERLASLVRDGKAAKRSDIESVSKEFWTQLDRRVAAAGLKEEYDFLEEMSQRERICIGVKRGLLGDLTGDYIWFLVLIYGTAPNEPGNAVAMEAVSEEGEMGATYFFRLVGRKDYQNYGDIEKLHGEFDRFVKAVNRCMIDINFRREPIYLTDDALSDPKYARYRFAVQKLPSLRTLRDLFIGRVIHSSIEQWKADVTELLKFNVGTLDDSEKWRKGAE